MPNPVQSLRPVRSRIVALAIVTSSLATPPAAAAPARSVALPASPDHAATIARLSVPTGTDPEASIAPGPFAVLPGGRRIVIQVPASEGLLVIEGSRLVHHLKLPRGSIVHDLAATDGLLVAGGAHAGGRVTISLAVFEVASGEMLIHVESANPFLRMHPDSSSGWRVVAGMSRAGIFHPSSAASYPLWAKETGIVPSSEQIGRALAGIGFERGLRWVPEPDGSVGLRRSGRTVTVLPAGHGTFVDGLPDDVVLMGTESDGHVIHLTAFRDGAAVGELRLPARDPDVPPFEATFTGRPVRVHDGSVYWAHIGHDALEIRAFRPSFPRSEAAHRAPAPGGS